MASRFWWSLFDQIRSRAGQMRVRGQGSGVRVGAGHHHMSLSSFWRSFLQEPLPPDGISSVSSQLVVSHPCCFILVKTWGSDRGGGKREEQQ